MLFKSTVHLVSFLLLFLSSSQAKVNWLQNLVNYTTKNSHQVLFIADEKLSNSSKETAKQIINKFKQKIPLILMNFNETQNKNFLKLKLLNSLQNPKTNVIIIMTHYSQMDKNFSQLHHPIDFLTRAMSTAPRSKCIFIFLSNSREANFKKLLLQMWRNLFLNTIIIEIQMENVSEREILSKAWNSMDNAYLHYYNPFRNEFPKRRLDEQWRMGEKFFVDKLKNLNGYRMKVGLFNTPPFVYVRRNSSGDVVSAFGIDVPIVMSLAKMMNFTITPTRTNVESWGTFDCNKTKTNGINYQLMHNQIQFVVSRGFLSINYCKVSPTADILYQVTSVKSLAPILRETEFKLTGSWDLLYMILTILLFFFFVVVLLHILNLQMPSWQLFNVIQIMLGMSIPEDLSIMSERIIFGWLLLTCAFYSSNITAIFTDFSLETENEVPMNTLNDLYNTNIKLIRHMRLGVTKDYDETTWKLINRSEPQFDATTVCLKRLRNREIVSCLLIEIQAERLFHLFRDENGDMSLKIIKEPLILYVEGMQLEPGSPYVERFSNLISRMKQSGIYDKWRMDTLKNGTDEKIGIRDFQMYEDPVKIQLILLFIAFLGYFASFLVFLVECFLFQIQLKVTCFLTVLHNHWQR